ncbi:hypothetical protein FYJ75_00270 [Roseburia sp. MUC/MUC-530-WT-4D]|uniref:Uncharacterized protein n=1 Tax=Roseburia porci TaxID=2605790 RepID=A0A6L5YNS4_9FIRM|nr:hypothetical protein [Roseburia porci]MST73466.1 hypothetical protein [Roseburia porci]
MAEYALKIHNREYELPKKTISVQERIDKIDDDNEKKLLPKRKKYENMFAFVKDMVGEDAAKEIFETDDLSRIDDIDLCTITISYLGIVDAYSKAIRDYQMDGSESAINNEVLGKVISLAKSVETIQNVTSQVQK